MQQLKPLAELLQPDPANSFFGKFDLKTGEAQALALEDMYPLFSAITLHDSVPEDVRNYMESIKTLAVFGWFHYPLYTHAVFLATTALEMALRERFPVTGGDKRTMRPLIEEARRAGLVRDDLLPSSKRWHGDDADSADGVQGEKTAETTQPQESYAEYAWRMMLFLRNKFLHQQQSTILTPWMAAEHLSLAAEMINALFADAGSSSGGGH